MAIYAVSDLHLSFNTNKPMDIFGWDNYEKIIEDNWKQTVTDNDLVLLPGDFSWEMKLENTAKDFSFLHQLPGKKLLLKGNHDYWWNTLKKMREYLQELQFVDIDFLYNNSYLFDDYIIAGTRGWSLEDGDEKMQQREVQRLEMSILDGISKYGKDKDIIVCMHYPPLSQHDTHTAYTDILEKYHIKKCIYGHLHGRAHQEVIEGKINEVEYQMVSCDYLKFQLKQISE